MLGIFGAGVLTAFQQANIYPRVHSIYSSSAGAHNAAYFLSKQTKLGSSIYYENLIGNKFIKRGKIAKHIFDVLFHKFNNDAEISGIIDIDYLTTIETKQKKLNVKKLISQNIPFYINLFNVETFKSCYIDGRKLTLRTLKASAAAAPYYTKVANIKGKFYIDGGIFDTSGFLGIIKKNINKNVVYIINRRKNFIKELIYLPVALTESLLLSTLYGKKVAKKYLSSTFRYPKLKELNSFDNVHLVINKKHYSKICTNKEKLMELYFHGIEKGNELINKLK